MDLRHLRTFAAVAEHGTVSKAALALHVAQPALSRQIGDLEQELGVRLFDRIRRRLLLTREGEQLLRECHLVLGGVDTLRERAHQLQRADVGTLKVAATPQTIEGVFSTFLHRYAARRPNVRIELREAVGHALPTMLERGEIHLGISLLQLIQADTHPFETLTLAPMEFLAACSPARALSEGATMDIRGLGSHPLLLLDSSFFVRTIFDAACRVAGFRPSIFMESRSPHTLLALAEANHGVAVVPSVLPTHRYKLRIVRLCYQRKPLREHLTVVWDKRRALPSYAQDFCQALAAYMRESSPTTERPDVTASPRAKQPAAGERKGGKVRARMRREKRAPEGKEKAGPRGPG